MESERGRRGGSLNAGLRLLGLSRGPLALASASPRRRELLERMEIPLVVIPTRVPEGNRRSDEAPGDYVRRLADEKARAALPGARAAGAHACLGADTIVELDGEVLEKPSDENEADAFLATLGGRWHTVWTGLSLHLVAEGRSGATHETTRVYFAPLSRELRRVYVETGEPMDKAGAYGIQGYGGLFVPRIEGDYFNVMGLPLAALRGLCLDLDGGRER